MNSHQHEQYMRRCLELARQGQGFVQPNPLVGCVIVKDDRIIGEGYHSRYGGNHGEIEALNSISNGNAEGASLYVNLEPCCHTGNTPPCTNRIIQEKIAHVVIGCLDVNPLVAGRGRTLLEENGILTTTGVLEQDCHFLNRRFETFHSKRRPYVILKWAQTFDGFIARADGSSKWISSEESRKLVHQWRHEEAGILVGTNTAKIDDPELTVRAVKGNNPARLVIDKRLSLNKRLKLFDGSVPTFVFTEKTVQDQENLSFIQIDFHSDVLPQVMDTCYQYGLSSLFVEGGASTLQHFLNQGLWDEARVFTSSISFKEGLRAPALATKAALSKRLGPDTLDYYYNS